MKKQLSLVIFLLAVGCFGSSHAAMEAFVSIPPQKWIVDQVGGEFVHTNILVAEGQNPHHFEPSPKLIADLTRAKVWFTMGMEFELQLVQKVKGVAPNLKIIDITALIQRIPLQQEEHEEGDHHEEHHDHDGLDPHVWLSPMNLISMTGVVRETLSNLDQEHAALFMENNTRINSELTALHKKISTMLAPFKHSSIFVFHPSFGYFTHTYGLEQQAVEIEGRSPEPRKLSKLIAKAKADKVKVIFVQPQFDSKSGQAIAAAIGGEVVPLDALAEDVKGNLMNMAHKVKAALKQ